MHTQRLALLFCSALVMPACGGGGEAKKGPTADEKAAEAKKKEQEEADAKAVAERKAKREAEEKVKAEAAAKVTEELAKVIALPAKLPKDPVAACDDAGKAQDAFVRRVGGPEGIKAWDEGGKDKAIPMTVVQCTQADSLEAAACMKNAFDTAGESLKDASKQISQACIDKFPSKTKRPPGGAMPKKRPGG